MTAGAKRAPRWLDENRDGICDRCGVKVTHSRVRRQRMGHISLAAPVVREKGTFSILKPSACSISSSPRDRPTSGSGPAAGVPEGFGEALGEAIRHGLQQVRAVRLVERLTSVWVARYVADRELSIGEYDPDAMAVSALFESSEPSSK